LSNTIFYGVVYFYASVLAPVFILITVDLFKINVIRFSILAQLPTTAASKKRGLTLRKICSLSLQLHIGFARGFLLRSGS
jgi:hypothetical protein